RPRPHAPARPVLNAPRGLAGLCSARGPATLEWTSVTMRTYLQIKGQRVEEISSEVVREQPLSVYVNGEKFLTLLCSPTMLESLIVGYLWMEKVIADIADVVDLQVSPVDGRAEV